LASHLGILHKLLAFLINLVDMALKISPQAALFVGFPKPLNEAMPCKQQLEGGNVFGCTATKSLCVEELTQHQALHPTWDFTNHTCLDYIDNEHSVSPIP
jgi:hypothetical protein